MELLQIATAQFITKCDGHLLQIATAFLLQSATPFITNCDRYYKVRWFHYNLRQVLQSAMIITNCDSTMCLTHIPSGMSFPYSGTIPSGMCSSTQDTHITSDSVLLPGKHISLVICVPLRGNTYPQWNVFFLPGNNSQRCENPESQVPKRPNPEFRKTYLGPSNIVSNF